MSKMKDLNPLASLPFSLPVFVVSLEGSARREFVSEHLKSLGINFKFFDAVRGRVDIEKDLFLSQKGVCFSPELSPGEVGCWRSHLGLLRKIADENIPFALVLEDDFKIENLDLLIKQICLFEALNREVSWDWIKLFQVNKIKALWHVFAQDEIALSVPFKRGFSSMAYLVSHQGARKFLDYLGGKVERKGLIYEPIDRYLDNTHRCKIDLLVSDLGSIEESSHMQNSEILNRAPELRTKFQKFKDSLGMRYAAWRTFQRFKRYKKIKGN
jgi:glycosyl transferase family 25